MESVSATKRNILYYPTINIPTDDWLRNALLYWDEVSSIVPQDWEDKHLIELSSDIEYLIKEEQFRAVRPEIFTSEGENFEMLQVFQQEFIDNINSEEFTDLMKRKRQKLVKIHGAKIPMNNMVGKGSRIHQNKTNDNLIYFLEEKGLARRNAENYEWISFEITTALIYMSLLAKYLARIDKQSTVIGTDFSVYEKFNFHRVKKEVGSPIISCDLRGIVPSPAKNISIKDIVKFKRKRESNLIAFRKVLMDVQNKISTAESNEHLKDIMTSFQEELRTGLTDMAAVFKDSRIDLIFKSLKSLINYKSSATITGAAVMLNEKFKVTGLPTWVEALAIAAAGAIEVGTIYIDSRNKQKTEDSKSAFSYLYHAQKMGIVNKFS